MKIKLTCRWNAFSNERSGKETEAKGIREVVKTITLEQDRPNHKIDNGVCLHPACLTSKDG